MFSKITLCTDAKSSSVTEFEFYLMWERFSLSHCLQHSVAVIHQGTDLENIVTHRSPVFCSSSHTCKAKLKKIILKNPCLFISHVHNRMNGNTNEITLCSPNSSTCIRLQIICYQSCLDDIKHVSPLSEWYGCIKFKMAWSHSAKSP